MRASGEEWCVDVLKALLDDKRSVEGYMHDVDLKDHNRRLPIRVCDGAADALQALRPELKFTMVGDHKELDRQIKNIRAKLSAQ
jgi:hypothetical protein